MATQIPPPPLYAKSDQPVWLDWFIRLATILNTTSATATNNHQALLNLQGGKSTERYHLSASQAANLTSYTAAPSNIAVGASPFTHQNAGSFSEDVIVSGGTVSAITFSRDNITFYTLPTSGMFHLSPSDRLVVTYTAAPTMTSVPRGYQ